jgi:S-adenosylmethionine-diacylgycerolhomoserine-N-methlytransferase
MAASIFMNVPIEPGVVEKGLTGKAGARMDAIYRHQRHFYDLSRKYYLLGRDRLIDRLEPAHGATVLEIGCGTGRNLIRAARRHPDARYFGIDISREMLATAGTNIAKESLRDRIKLACGDAADFDPEALFGVARFDRVFLSYTLSMIPPWRAVLQGLPRLLSACGEIHIVDFGQQERLPRSFRTMLFAWLERFDVEPRAELADALSAIAANNSMTLDFDRLYRGYAWAAEMRWIGCADGGRQFRRLSGPETACP